MTLQWQSREGNIWRFHRNHCDLILPVLHIPPYISVFHSPKSHTRRIHIALHANACNSSQHILTATMAEEESPKPSVLIVGGLGNVI